MNRNKLPSSIQYTVLLSAADTRQLGEKNHCRRRRLPINNRANLSRIAMIYYIIILLCVGDDVYPIYAFRVCYRVRFNIA